MPKSATKKLFSPSLFCTIYSLIISRVRKSTSIASAIVAPPIYGNQN